MANWVVEGRALALGIISADVFISSWVENLEAEAWRKKDEEEWRRQELLLRLSADVVIAGVCAVPTGEFLMGSNKSRDEDAQVREVPQHTLSLPEYLVGKCPVTVAQFAAFVKATGFQCAKKALRPLDKFGNHPVHNVSWNDAVAFCAWASQAEAGLTQGRAVRLPSEAEWEKAARGTDGRIYPWANEPPDAKRCNFNLNMGNTTPVGQYSPLGDSPYGCADMAGNVSEWTSSLYRPYPYKADDGREGEDLEDRESWVLRGGGWTSEAQHVRAAYRCWIMPDWRADFFGFRCVRGTSPSRN